MFYRLLHIGQSDSTTQDASVKPMQFPNSGGFFFHSELDVICLELQVVGYMFIVNLILSGVVVVIHGYCIAKFMLHVPVCIHKGTPY